MTLYPGGDLYPEAASFVSADVATSTPSSAPAVRVAPASILVHVGEMIGGRITATIPVTAASWQDTLNGNGTISATVAASVVKQYDLRNATNGARCFLAIERDGRVKAAGPIWSRTWDWEKGELTLGAAGIWSWLDKRVITPATVVTPYQKNTYAITGKSLGGLARALVSRAITSTYSNVPIVLPADESGSNTESFPLWSLLYYGEQLRQITQRATDAPDIMFLPRRRLDDDRYIEWVMRVGTAMAPALSQAPSPDWQFDASTPRSGVFGISTDEDASDMAEQVWVTGNGQEQAILMARAGDSTLNALGWPLTETDDSLPTVEKQTTLDGSAATLLGRSNRPVESYTVTVAAEMAAEIRPGDYGQLTTRGDVWLGNSSRRMRVKTISGDLTDRVALDMFPLQATP